MVAMSAMLCSQSGVVRARMRYVCDVADPRFLRCQLPRFDSGTQLDVVDGLLTQVRLARTIEGSELVGGAEAVVQNVERCDARHLLGVGAVVPYPQPHFAIVVRIIYIRRRCSRARVSSAN